jgi:hypothetical protein
VPIVARLLHAPGEVVRFSLSFSDTLLQFAQVTLEHTPLLAILRA